MQVEASINVVFVRAATDMEVHVIYIFPQVLPCADDSTIHRNTVEKKDDRFTTFCSEKEKKIINTDSFLFFFFLVYLSSTVV